MARKRFGPFYSEKITAWAWPTLQDNLILLRRIYDVQVKYCGSGVIAMKHIRQLTLAGSCGGLCGEGFQLPISS